MDPSFDTESIFGGCGAIIFVIDAQVIVYTNIKNNHVEQHSNSRMHVST
jgi:hypothetical protein